MKQTVRALTIAAAVGLSANAAPATAGVTLQTQQRTLSVSTSANGGTQSVSAPAFGPFVETLSLETTFPAPGGLGTVTNGASGRIDCQIDPNAIRARGTFAVAGGQNDAGESEVGDAKTDIRVTFVVSQPTPFGLAAAPRPGILPTDSFQLRLRDVDRHDDIIVLDQTMPPEAVSLRGTLLPGTYMFRYSAESSSDVSATTRDFSFGLSLGCTADFNGDSIVSVQDIFDFIDAWFTGDAHADTDLRGGIAVEDIFYFLNSWFAGC